MMQDSYLPEMIRIACAAGAVIDEVYMTGFSAQKKEDGSSVTIADQKAETLILEQLAKSFPDIPVLAEEAASEGKIPELGEVFFLVDPLDGTREFINRSNEFTVNIALIQNDYPVAGVIYAPATQQLYYGAVGAGAFKQTCRRHQPDGNAQSINTNKINPQTLIAVASRSHRSAETDQFLKETGAKDFTSAGSSLKFCLLAEGKADVYPRLGRTMEWDTGAGQAILEAAGGSVHRFDDMIEGERLSYNKKARGFDNPHFIAWGKRIG